MMNNKKAVSGIVITVLLILVAITAVALVAAFLIPFIKGSLDKGSECFGILGKTEIVRGDYTCYDSTVGSQVAKVMIKRNFASGLDLDGYAIVFSGAGQSKRFDVSAANMPAEGESKAYTYTTVDGIGTFAIDSVEISPKLKIGTVCEGISMSSIPACP